MATIHPALRTQFGTLAVLGGVLICASCSGRVKDGTPAVSRVTSTDSTAAAGSSDDNTGAAIREQIFTLTPKAAERLRLLRDNGKLKKNAVARFRVVEGNFFRFKGGGDKRYRYSMLLDDDVKNWENFYVMESQGFTVIVDKDSAEFLRGTELWWLEAGGKGGFKFQNPNELGDDDSSQKGEPILDPITPTPSSPTLTSPTLIEE
ncbi:MAG: iron-sulfur cluster assembly accessory protein [Candidatus Saccharimonas sp.]|nr:iron-sulfur cluster assembly accessory protein [Planctomycetaceae bacterium]